MKRLLFLFLCLHSIAEGQIITTIAGNGTMGYTGDGSPASAYGLYYPARVAVDASDNVYIADAYDNRIRKVTPSGVITTIAGTGISGSTGDGGSATLARITNPYGIAADATGNIYITDGNLYVRKISPSGTITRIAGSGISGYGGDGGPATDAGFIVLDALAVDLHGNVFIADDASHRVRKINTSGIITTVAGNGTPGNTGDSGAATAAEIGGPEGLAVDAIGNLYIADLSENVIRKVDTSGIISTIAGNGTMGYSGDGTPATGADLNGPTDVWVDGDHDVFIADFHNNVVRKVNTAGIISTIAGNGTPGFGGDGGNATAATLFNPHGVAGDAAGNLYIADQFNNRVRKISCVSPTVGPIASPGSICFGAISFLLDSPSGGTWSSSNTAVATVGSSTGMVSGISAGTTVITYTISNICGAGIATTVMTVDPSVSTPPISGPGTVCTGAFITLTDGVTGGSWSASNGNATVSSPGGIVVGVSPGVDTITYSVFAACSPLTTVSHIVTVNPTRYAGSISGPLEICVSTPVTLIDTVTGGTWHASNGNAAITGGILTGVMAGVDTISYTVVAGSCSSSAVAIETIDGAVPDVAAISGPSAVCTHAAIILTDSSIGGIWTASNTNASVVAGSVTGLVVGIDTIYYSMSNVCGTSSATSTITVDPLPDAGVIGGPSSICTSGTAVFFDTAAGGAWTSSAGGIATVSAGGLVDGISAGTATISYSVVNSCGTASATIITTVIPTPGSIAGGGIFCRDTTVTLMDLTPGGLWSSSNTGVAIVDPGAGVVTGISDGTATITYTVGGECYTTASITVISACISGIQTLSNAEKISIFPNPAKAELTISSADEIKHVSISDLLGKEEYSSSPNVFRYVIDIAALSPGIYFIKINGTSVRTFAKQ